MRKLSKTQVSKVNMALDNHEKLKKSYFWNPKGNASSRRYEDIEEFRSLYAFDSIHLDLINRRVILTNIVEWQGETS